MTEEKKDIAWRVYLIYFAVCLFGMLILGKALSIQLLEGAELRKMVQSQTLVDKNIEAVRGNIMAEDGSLLATSIPIYEIRFDPNTSALSKEVFYSKLDSLAYCLIKLFKDQSKNAYKLELTKARESGSRFHLIKRNVKYTELKKLKEF